MGIKRDPHLSTDPAADISAAVFLRMQEILGENNTIETHQESSVRHVSVEEAMKELLEIQRANAEPPQASEQ